MCGSNVCSFTNNFHVLGHQIGSPSSASWHIISNDWISRKLEIIISAYEWRQIIVKKRNSQTRMQTHSCHTYCMATVVQCHLCHHGDNSKRTAQIQINSCWIGKIGAKWKRWTETIGIIIFDFSLASNKFQYWTFCILILIAFISSVLAKNLIWNEKNEKLPSKAFLTQKKLERSTLKA